MLNELKYIHTKIHLMNEMSSQMTTDYAKYSQLVNKVKELSKQRQLVERYHHRQTVDEEKERVSSESGNHCIDPADVDFYTSHEAKQQLENLRRNLDKPGGSPSGKEKRKSVDFADKPQVRVDSSLHLDDDLSDLKGDEEARLKQLLRESLQSERSSNNNSVSVTNVLKEVFEDLSVENENDLDSAKLDQMLNMSLTPRNQRSPTKYKTPSKTSSKTSSKKSAISPKPTTLPSSQNHSTPKSITSTSPSKPKPCLASNAKATHNRTVSPIVYKERVMQERRDHLKELNIQQREQDAQQLLEEILIENYELEAITRRSPGSSLSPSPTRIVSSKSKSKSPITINRTFKLTTGTKTSKKPIQPKTGPKIPAVKVPLLVLNSKMKEQVVDSLNMSIEIAEIQKESKKPSLMAQTIFELAQKESHKQNEAERTLRDLENRARNMAKIKNETRVISNGSQASRPPMRIIKSFTNFVHLQDPSKLRGETEHKPLTYTQQLMQHQDRTVNIAPDSKEIFKVFGTQRVPGVFRGYTKTTRRKTKTYTQMLKDLVPAQSQAKVSLPVGRNYTVLVSSRNIASNMSKMSNCASVNNRHNLKTKVRVDAISKVNKIINKQRRFNPYKSPLNNNLDELDELELSTWSLDEQMKNIIYDDGLINGSKRNNEKNQEMATKKRVTYKETDQDTLADMDGDCLLDELLEDEMQNEKIFQECMKDLSNLERRSKNSYDEDEDDYINQVNVDDLKNLSLSSESVLSSFIDWDQVEQLIKKF